MNPCKTFWERYGLRGMFLTLATAGATGMLVMFLVGSPEKTVTAEAMRTCSGRGSYRFDAVDTCTCEVGYTGQYCESKRQPVQDMYGTHSDTHCVDDGSIDISLVQVNDPNPITCSGHGNCNDLGECECHPNYSTPPAGRVARQLEQCTVTCPGLPCCGGYGACAQGVCTCDAGYLKDETGSCAACVRGKFAAFSASSECSECPAGEQSAAGKSSCTACSTGQFSLAGSACAACQSGTFNARSRQSACKACAVGKSSLANRTGCETIVCIPGEYRTGPTCTACPVGQYTPTALAAELTICTRCPVGKTSNAAKTGCVIDPLSVT